jgi:hypothetical protein
MEILGFGGWSGMMAVAAGILAGLTGALLAACAVAENCSRRCAVTRGPDVRSRPNIRPVPAPARSKVRAGLVLHARTK